MPGLLEIIFMLTLLLVGFGSIALWIWMIIDCATKEPAEGNDKVVWIIVIVLAQLLGALIYLFVRRPRRIQKYGS